MKKAFIQIAALAFIITFCFIGASALSSTATVSTTPIITIEDQIVDFSPDGYTVQASVNLPEYEPLIQYVAIRKSDSVPVAFPIIDAGEYYIRAYLPATEAYDEIEAIASLTIKPVEATIVIKYTTEKYTGIANPPKYSIEPAWAEDYINIMTTYYEIYSLESTSYNPIDTPRNLGYYYTVMNPYGYGNNFICNSKTFIYEIAESQGEELLYFEARASVPSYFRCEMKETEVEYSGNQIQIPYTAYPSIVNYKIEYRKISYTGAPDEFTAQAPVEPGEYEVRATLLGETISESTLIIKKISPIFDIEAKDYQYNSNGILPKVNLVYPSNIEYTTNAYLVDENDSTIMKPVELPL